MYLEIDYQEAVLLKKHISAVIITATEIEKTCLHQAIKPLPGYSGIIVTYHKLCTYYIGILGNYIICHVQSRMGSINAGASIMTTNQSINDWGTKTILMVGIAFGINKKKQNIGDILVADSIAQYDSRRISSDEIINRGAVPLSSSLLLDRFRNLLDWNYAISDDKASKVILGQVLSGEALVDNIKFRDLLVESWPTAIGGEMEGAGLAATAHAMQCNWLLVKGICDFADGKKSRNKKINQSIAINAAVDLCHHVFSKQTGFEDIGFINISKIKSFKVNNIPDAKLIGEVLFNVYDNDEKYYILRNFDTLVQNCIKMHSVIWLYGKSGVGKTTAIYRNIDVEKRKKIVADLSDFMTYDIVQIFNYVYELLLNLFKLPLDSYVDNFIGISKKIVDLIKANESDICVVFEEIPIDNKKEFSDFVHHITSFVIKLNRALPSIQIKFILTSIDNPKSSIASQKTKILENMYLLLMHEWSKIELNELVRLICDKLSINITDEEEEILIDASLGSPRYIKKFFKNFLILKGNDKILFEDIISTTTLDLK